MWIGWVESNFTNPTVKVWADLDNPFKRSDYAKLCMSPSLDGTCPEYVISQEDNSPLTLYIDFHNYYIATFGPCVKSMAADLYRKTHNVPYGVLSYNFVRQSFVTLETLCEIYRIIARGESCVLLVWLWIHIQLVIFKSLWLLVRNERGSGNCVRTRRYGHSGHEFMQSNIAKYSRDSAKHSGWSVVILMWL